MEFLLSGAILIVTGLVAIPVAVLLFEVIAAALLPARSTITEPTLADRGTVAVLVPAHDESRAILPTLADLRGQLRPSDRLIVVADNCEDDTAVVAAAAGAEVVERHDPARRGKGYALDFGLQHIAPEPPSTVVIVDADCRLPEGTIDRLATTCTTTGRPVQALYIMTAPDEAGIGLRIAEFAWCVKNGLRPAGLRALGLPCQLAGTGMAFPWHVIRSANLASGETVEDLKLGLDLAAAGHAPLFCPDACVTSTFPTSEAGIASQRRRWEQGHISTIACLAPTLLWQAIVHRDRNLLVLALDLSVPPLSLLAMQVLAIVIFSALLAILGLGAVALFIGAASLAAFVFATTIAWFQVGREVLPARDLWSVAPYVFGKLGLYRRILADRSDRKWIRTDRSSGQS